MPLHFWSGSHWSSDVACANRFPQLFRSTGRAGQQVSVPFSLPHALSSRLAQRSLQSKKTAENFVSVAKTFFRFPPFFRFFIIKKFENCAHLARQKAKVSIKVAGFEFFVCREPAEKFCSPRGFFCFSPCGEAVKEEKKSENFGENLSL